MIETKDLHEAYRNWPLMSASMGDHRRKTLRGAIGALASINHLKETTSYHRNCGFNEESSFMANLKNRLKACEESLAIYEAELYGETNE